MGNLKIETTTGKVSDIVVTDTKSAEEISDVISVEFGTSTVDDVEMVTATITVIPASIKLSSVEGAIKQASVSANA